jgi:hypothetical protein
VTTQGVIVIDAIGLVLILWILDLIRHGRLYVGYGVILAPTIFVTMIVVSVPRVLTLVTRVVGGVFPASALTLLALGFFFLMLVYVLIQLTILSGRVATLVQELAIERAREPTRRGTPFSDESRSVDPRDHPPDQRLE